MPLLPKTPSLSRRTLLRGLGGSAALGALGALAGCGVPAAYVAPGDRAATDRSAGERRLTWANWPLYIDTDDDHPGRPHVGPRTAGQAWSRSAAAQRSAWSLGHVEQLVVPSRPLHRLVPPVVRAPDARVGAREVRVPHAGPRRRTRPVASAA
ncbi:hypothetical protein SVIOM342S_00127 [Streptomyces violaceorubidus]